MMHFRTNAVQHHGLRNQGATCYLNSVLQVLFMTREFREAVDRHTHYLDRHLGDLFNELQRHTTFTHTLTHQLSIRVWEQEDAAEYFVEIVTRSSPEASQIFRGQLIHKTKCSKCNTVKKTEPHFWLLPLALMDSNSKTYSVVDGIREFFRDSHFRGLDQMYCEECDDKVDATVTCEVKHHPEVLVLLLKRFDFDYHYMRYVKSHQAVDVNLSLHIPENQTYELYAAVDHVGDLRGGHYTATIKNQDEDQWYNFNDERVTRIRPIRLEKTKNAYLLFYKKKQKMSDAPKECEIIKIENQCRYMKNGTFTPKNMCLLFRVVIILSIVVVTLSRT
ncbi:ubiquitin carboxyl-terminal hydrolase 47-like isoform X2 [Betta splendens]|uniref:Ubiquitin carboxyl-terminal hydrolase 47-like isoform X2 n=1 Tax=Betta splendens TaxID=158456 RepID=A0A9W2XL16_BETSP|nr:ubiquitin carboxyl-terminal hydrolase 47-like isoform X2 [Betta splendens]